MKKLVSLLLGLSCLIASAATFPTDFNSVPNVQARANVTNIASIPLALQSGTALDWSGGAHEKRLFRAITTDTTFTFANLPTSATNSVTLVLYLTNNGPAGVASVTFPAAVQWPQTFGAPTILQLSNSVTRYEFEHMGGGRVFGYDRSRFTVLAAGTNTYLTTSGNTTKVHSVVSPSTNWLTDVNGNGYGVNVFKLTDRSGLDFLKSYSNSTTNGGNTGVRITVSGANPFEVFGGDSVFFANVDIGTAANGGTLDILATPGNTNWIFRAGTNSSGNGLTVSSNGMNVGIGTATPTAITTISNTTATTPSFSVFGSNNPVPQLTIASNGNVGIGTASPVAKFQIQGTAFGSIFGFGETEDIYLRPGTSTGATYVNDISSGTVNFTGSGNVIFNNAAQKVGIGITTPLARSHTSNSTAQVAHRVDQAVVTNNIQEWYQDNARVALVSTNGNIIGGHTSIGTNAPLAAGTTGYTNTRGYTVDVSLRCLAASITKFETNGTILFTNLNTSAVWTFPLKPNQYYTNTGGANYINSNVEPRN